MAQHFGWPADPDYQPSMMPAVRTPYIHTLLDLNDAPDERHAGTSDEVLHSLSHRRIPTLRVLAKGKYSACIQYVLMLTIYSAGTVRHGNTL